MHIALRDASRLIISCSRRCVPGIKNSPMGKTAFFSIVLWVAVPMLLNSLGLFAQEATSGESAAAASATFRGKCAYTRQKLSFPTFLPHSPSVPLSETVQIQTLFVGHYHLLVPLPWHPGLRMWGNTTLIDGLDQIFNTKPTTFFAKHAFANSTAEFDFANRSVIGNSEYCFNSNQQRAVTNSSDCGTAAVELNLGDNSSMPGSSTSGSIEACLPRGCYFR